MARKILDGNGNVLKIDGKEVWGIDFDIEVKQADIEYGKRVISMIGSTPSIDRDNDIIVQSGWDTKAFKKSSPVLWSHDHKIPAIAKVNKFKKTKDALTFDEIEFPEKGIHPLSDMVYELMIGGFIKAGSVGFLPIKSEKRERTEEEEKTEPQSFCPPTKFLKQELLEFSIVNVGSNRDAIVTHLGQKGFQTTGKILVPTENGNEVAVDAMDVLNKLFVEDKRVIPHKKYPLDPEDAAWDGPKERAAASVEVLRRISTWFDSEKPDIKSSYKLPHHRAEGHNTVWRGVRAAMGALLGARGGVDVPEGDRRGIFNHLRSHYLEFDKEVPEFKDYEDAELKEMFPELLEEKELSEGGIVTDAKSIMLGDGEPEAVIPIPNKEKDSDPKDKEYTAEILRLKDGGFLLDLHPNKEAIKNNTRYSVEFTSDTERCTEANLYEWDKDKKEWKTIQTISIQDIEQKAGAVLNKTNKKRLKDAQQLIGEVLAESEPADSADKNEPDITQEPPEKEIPALELTLSPEFKALFDQISEKIEAIELRLDDKGPKPPKESDDIDLDSIEAPKKKEVGIDLKEVGKILENTLHGVVKKVVDQRFDKALGKV